jgi:glycosyltransferase involved in cell wall biosynthesis
MKFSVSHQKHLVTFTPQEVRSRILMIPFATDAELIAKVLELGENQHHAWGVKELLGANVEVAVARRYHSRWERFGQDWRLPDTSGYDLIYSNHNRLIRTPLESLLRSRDTPFVSLVYAGELLFAPKRHFGLLCMTPHAYSRFETLDPVRVRYAPWGIDPDSKLHQPLEPLGEHFISSGVTGRDFKTLMQAAAMVEDRVVVAARGQQVSSSLSNVKVVDQFISPWGVRDLYTGSYAALLVLQRDEKKRSAVGWTNMLELMAVGLPIIKTRTGSLDDIVDLEAIGAGILVEPENPEALARAMVKLRENPELRRSMGHAGAAYVRSHLTMQQFGERLIEMVGAARGRR